MEKQRDSNPNKRVNDNSVASQRQRVLLALREAGEKGITTISFRENYDVMHPAARVQKLRRNHGHNIHSIWDRDKNAQGNEHSCGRYVMFPGKWKEG